MNHGIGKYLGITTLEINGVHKDYLQIKYQGSDKLFVPVDQIDLVQKYVGAEEKEPKLYKLGGSEWKRVKRKVQSSVQDIADDLIKLTRKGKHQKGMLSVRTGICNVNLKQHFLIKKPKTSFVRLQKLKRHGTTTANGSFALW